MMVSGCIKRPNSGSVDVAFFCDFLFEKEQILAHYREVFNFFAVVGLSLFYASSPIK